MSTEIPRPNVTGPNDIVIEIPPPEVGIKKVNIPTTGVLRIEFAPVNAPKSTNDTKLASFSNSNYSLTTKGTARAEATAWFSDDSVRAARMSDTELDLLVGDLNNGDEHTIDLTLDTVVASTQTNPAPNPDLVAFRIEGELSVDYKGPSATGGVGTVAWAYHIDVVRLKQLENSSTQAATSKQPQKRCDTSV